MAWSACCPDFVRKPRFESWHSVCSFGIPIEYKTIIYTVSAPQTHVKIQRRQSRPYTEDMEYTCQTCTKKNFPINCWLKYTCEGMRRGEGTNFLFLPPWQRMVKRREGEVHPPLGKEQTVTDYPPRKTNKRCKNCDSSQHCDASPLLSINMWRSSWTCANKSIPDRVQCRSLCLNVQTNEHGFLQHREVV